MRFLLSILSIIYLYASIGATIHLHYCMGRIANVDFLHKHEKQCGICGMEKSDESDNGCCKDESETVKITIDQKTSPAKLFHFEQPFTSLVAMWVPVIPDFGTLFAGKVPPVSHAPPRSQQVPVYLMHAVFRI